ncbi:MAG: hypothetical protein NXY57DRAFT_1002668, partial [Lentinula lateritia]
RVSSLPIAALSLSLRATLSVTTSHIFDSTATTTFSSFLLFLENYSKQNQTPVVVQDPSQLDHLGFSDIDLLPFFKEIFSRKFPSKNVFGCTFPKHPVQMSRYGRCWYRRCQR